MLVLAGCDMPAVPSRESATGGGVVRAHYAAPAIGREVSMLVAGDPAGRRIIYIHGTPGEAAGWRDHLRAPPAGTQVLAIDRPGFGLTRPGDALPSLAAQASAIAPLLIDRGGGWPILVGHSLGGPIAAQVAVDHPDKVSGLLIVAGSLDPLLERVWAVQPMGEWPLIRSLLPTTLRNANLELMALEADLRKLEPRLTVIACPVAVLHGTQDAQVPFANVAFMQRRMVSAKPLIVRSLEGRDHFLPWKERAEVDALLRRLLQSSEARC